MGIFSEDGMIGSLLHADETMKPKFDSPEQELAYLESARKTANDELMKIMEKMKLDHNNKGLLSQATVADKQALYWQNLIDDFTKDHPEFVQKPNSDEKAPIDER